MRKETNYRVKKGEKTQRKKKEKKRIKKGLQIGSFFWLCTAFIILNVHCHLRRSFEIFSHNLWVLCRLYAQ